MNSRTAGTKKPHILVISQYFYPEPFRINDLCAEWVKQGYRVTVLTGIPNYPEGKFYPGYGIGKKRKETWNGIEIIRIPLIPRGTGKLGMVLNYFSFPLSGFFWNLRAGIQADIVFMFETSPMTQCKIGVWYAKKHKVPLLLYAQDLWPENVEVITGIHNRRLLAPITKMTVGIYRACDRIYVTSPSFVDAVRSRGITKDKVSYWPQYAESFYRPSKSKSNQVIQDNAFRIIFTGNIGYAQGLDILPRTAALLKERGNTDIRFVIVGDGRYKETLREEIEPVKELFQLIPRQPAEKIPEFLAACDVAFLSFQDNPLWEMTIPAKLQSYLACSMPVLAAAGGETARIIQESGCGRCVPLGNAEELAKAVLRMKEEKEALPEQCRRAGEYYEKHFRKDMLIRDINQEIEDVLHPEKEKQEKQSMRILMINVVCGIRSTGRICADLADELEKQGHEVKIAYGREEVPEKYKKYAIPIGSSSDVALHGGKARLFDACGFGSYKATKKFLEWVKEYDPDIIHIHNLHGYYIHVGLLFEYLKESGKKVIWTMHDCWGFTGHAAFCEAAGCKKWADAKGCSSCPKKDDYPKSMVDRSSSNWHKKKDLFTGVSGMCLVTPSQWLADLAAESFLKEYPVAVIPNGIDLSAFRYIPEDKKDSPADENKTIVLGVGAMWEERKGLNDFIRLADMLDDSFRIVLVGITEEQKAAIPSQITCINRTNSVEELARLYSSADVFLNLTYEDNYPTTNMEAIACSTPVITYQTGGSPESVLPGCGDVVKQGDLEAVKKLLMEKYRHKNGNGTPEEARAAFDKTKTVEKYCRLYGLAADKKSEIKEQ